MAQVVGWRKDGDASDFLADERAEMAEISCDEVRGACGNRSEQDWHVFIRERNAGR